MNSSFRTNLPTTKSPVITEDKGTFLGLEGAGFLIVFGVFALTAVSIDLLTSFSGFPFALLLSTLLYLAMRAVLNGKPKKHLQHWIRYRFIPKKWSHQFSEKTKNPILPLDFSSPPSESSSFSKSVPSIPVDASVSADESSPVYQPEPLWP